MTDNNPLKEIPHTEGLDEVLSQLSKKLDRAGVGMIDGAKGARQDWTDAFLEAKTQIKALLAETKKDSEESNLDTTAFPTASIVPNIDEAVAKVLIDFGYIRADPKLVTLLTALIESTVLSARIDELKSFDDVGEFDLPKAVDNRIAELERLMK